MATRRIPGRGKPGDGDVLDPERLRDGLDDAVGGVLPGSPLATRAGAQLEDVARDALLHAQVALLRREGQLQPLIDAARATRSIDGLLRSGELAPGELAAIAKLDASSFNGKVDFNQAMAYSTRGVDVARLTSSGWAKWARRCSPGSCCRKAIPTSWRSRTPPATAST